MAKHRSKPYSPGHARRLRAAERKRVANALAIVASELPSEATEAARDQWRAPGMRTRVEQSSAPRVEPAPGPDTRIVVTRRHSCGLKMAGEWDPRKNRIEGDNTPPPPEAARPAPPQVEGERLLAFRRKRVPPPPGSASSVDSPFHRQGVWEPFNERNTQHCEPPQVATQLFNER